MKKISKWIRARIKYITEDIWQIPMGELPKRKSFIIREIRILVLAFKGFREDKVHLRASALTFNTLLSIIPIAAIAFGIAQSFGFRERLELEIKNALIGHEEVMDYILTITDNFLKTSSGGFIAGIGLLILIWSVMQVLNHIEKSFNHIWEIKKSRPWIRKFADYLSIMVVAPVFIVVAGSVTVFLNTKMDFASDSSFIANTIKPAIVFLLKFTPYVIMWLLLTMLYMVMPNTRVRFRSALVAGVIAGTLFQLTQLLYISSQIGVSKYSAIYGSFAAFPLFIVWMQISWLIVLLGAEISFANQNVNRYEFESESLNINSFQKRILTLLILNIIVKKFVSGEAPVSAAQLSKFLQIPVRLVRDILFMLCRAELLTEIIIDKPMGRLYQPAMDVRKLNIGFILARIDKTGGDDIPVNEISEYKKIKSLVEKYSSIISESEMNVQIGTI